MRDDEGSWATARAERLCSSAPPAARNAPPRAHGREPGVTDDAGSVRVEVVGCADQRYNVFTFPHDTAATGVGFCQTLLMALSLEADANGARPRLSQMERRIV